MRAALWVVAAVAFVIMFGTCFAAAWADTFEWERDYSSLVSVVGMFAFVIAVVSGMMAALYDEWHP